MNPRARRPSATRVPVTASTEFDRRQMRLALQLARRGAGRTSPNPMVGAVVTRGARVIGRGWHRRAGERHAEIRALRHASAQGASPRGATLYVTLEPCSTHGRTPPCVDAIIAAGVKRVVVAKPDPNPQHAGRGLRRLRRAGIEVCCGLLADEARALNLPFEHWIVHQTPWVTSKAAMTLDGCIAAASGESKWITGPRARQVGMRLRRAADAVLVGIGTVLADDPALTCRPAGSDRPWRGKRLRRIIVDTHARIPLHARVIADDPDHLTTVVVGRNAPPTRVTRLARQVRVLRAPERQGRADLRWLLRRLGREEVTHLLVEGGGEVHASFLLQGLAHQVVFFYAPKILGDRRARKAVAGEGRPGRLAPLRLHEHQWRRVGPDLMLTALTRPRRVA